MLQAIPARTPHAVNERVLGARDGWKFDGSRGWRAVDELHHGVAAHVEHTLRHHGLLTATLDESSMAAPFWDVSADGLHWGYDNAVTTDKFIETMAFVLLASL